MMGGISKFKQLRILHVAPYGEGAWGYGGIPRVVGALTHGLVARGHRLSVYTTDAADAHSRLAQAPPGPEGLETRHFPNLSNVLAYHLQLFLPRGLAAYMARHAGDFDVAHLHACHHLPGAIAGRFLRRAGVPYVLTPNGTAPRIERRRWAKALFDVTVGRRMLPDAAKVVAVSQVEVRQLENLGVHGRRIAVIPNPVEEISQEPRPKTFRRQWGLEDEAPIVLYLGKLTPRKQVEILVNAFAGLPRTGARLVIAGNDMGSGNRIRQRIHDLGLESMATLTGILRGAERFDALAAASVVVYPSRDEIFGLVPLEALLCGSPVVVADDSGCGEVISSINGGLVVPMGDVVALTEAILATLEDPTARRATGQAAARIRECYTVSPVCQAYEELYEEVIGSS